MRGELGLRLLGAALALAAAVVHLALSTTDLIPGEETRGPAFAAMGLGFVACGVGLFLRRSPYDLIVAVYAGALILAYVATRGEYPIESIGIASKAAEAGLLAVALLLARRDPQ